jgi:hypothetical protein
LLGISYSCIVVVLVPMMVMIISVVMVVIMSVVMVMMVMTVIMSIRPVVVMGMSLLFTHEFYTWSFVVIATTAYSAHNYWILLPSLVKTIDLTFNSLPLIISLK